MLLSILLCGSLGDPTPQISLPEKVAQLTKLIEETKSAAAQSFAQDLDSIKNELKSLKPPDVRIEYSHELPQYNFALVPFFLIAVDNGSAIISPDFVDNALVALRVTRQAEIHSENGHWILYGAHGRYIFRLRHPGPITKFTFSEIHGGSCTLTDFGVSAFINDQYVQVGQFHLSVGPHFQEFNVTREVKDVVGFRIDIIANRGNTTATCLPVFRIFAAL
jgi:hypothetical protein